MTQSECLRCPVSAGCVQRQRLLTGLQQELVCKYVSVAFQLVLLPPLGQDIN